VEVRPAATLILVRAGAAPLEVLMLRRHPASVFAADAWVFPGGQVDEADTVFTGTPRTPGFTGTPRTPGDPGGLGQGLTDAEASAMLGLASGGLAFWVAAVRECFEEAGILLARPAGAAAPGAEPARSFGPVNRLDAARLARHRRDLHAGRKTLAQVLAAEDLLLDLGAVHYVSHWITPPGDSRRFDTRFFLAAAPPAQIASHDAAETVDSIWTTPAAVLRRYAAGEVRLMFPTIKNLETLALFDTVEQLLEAARARTAPVVLKARIGGMRLQPPPDRSLHA
jgi:8-oxo-dGTP pyrophosphatase MutT (NUDIX family)